MSLTICVDASFVIKLVTDEPHSDRADELWKAWLEADAEIVAPELLPFEVTSVIRKKVQRGVVTPEDGAVAFDAFWEVLTSVALVPPNRLCARAWELASRYHQPNLYDAYYVALAEQLECALWTADDHLRRAMPDLAAHIASLADTKTG
jgi:predicted nucleic acid-binding protein